MRIGIHFGNIQAGVIGKTNFRFNVWGKTAIIANRLESLCVPQCVQVSEDTWRALGHISAKYKPIQYKEFDIKDMGKIGAYLLKPEFEATKEKTKPHIEVKESSPSPVIAERFHSSHFREGEKEEENSTRIEIEEKKKKKKKKHKKPEKGKA